MLLMRNSLPTPARVPQKASVVNNPGHLSHNASPWGFKEKAVRGLQPAAQVAEHMPPVSEQLTDSCEGGCGCLGCFDGCQAGLHCHNIKQGRGRHGTSSTLNPKKDKLPLLQDPLRRLELPQRMLAGAARRSRFRAAPRAAVVAVRRSWRGTLRPGRSARGRLLQARGAASPPRSDPGRAPLLVGGHGASPKLLQCCQCDTAAPDSQQLVAPKKAHRQLQCGPDRCSPHRLPIGFMNMLATNPYSSAGLWAPLLTSIVQQQNQVCLSVTGRRKSHQGPCHAATVNTMVCLDLTPLTYNDSSGEPVATTGLPRAILAAYSVP